MIFISNRKTEDRNIEVSYKTKNENLEIIEKKHEKYEIWKSVAENIFLLLSSAACVGDFTFIEAVQLASNCTCFIENNKKNKSISNSIKEKHGRTYPKDELKREETEENNINRIKLEDDELEKDRIHAISLMKSVLTYTTEYHNIINKNNMETVRIKLFKP